MTADQTALAKLLACCKQRLPTLASKMTQVSVLVDFERDTAWCSLSDEMATAGRDELHRALYSSVKLPAAKSARRKRRLSIEYLQHQSQHNKSSRDTFTLPCWHACSRKDIVDGTIRFRVSEGRTCFALTFASLFRPIRQGHLLHHQARSTESSSRMPGQMR